MVSKHINQHPEYGNDEGCFQVIEFEYACIVIQELSSGERTTPGSPDDMFLNDLNPCLTPYAKSKSKVNFNEILGSFFFASLLLLTFKNGQCRSLKPTSHCTIIQGFVKLSLVESCQKVRLNTTMSTQGRFLVEQLADQTKTSTPHMVSI